MNRLSIKEPVEMNAPEGMEYATLAGGCFWCTEAVFLSIDGVEKVVSGYIGGTIKNPAYREVTTGRTGHAEAIRILYDPKKVSFGELLEIFFATHDPTTLNRQGNDVGTQYRSEIFYYNDEQQEIATEYIKLMTAEKTFDNPIVTDVTPASAFYEAEDYHQNYYNQNKDQPYCNYVITPKMEKLQSKFAKKLKK
uniref:peptide-methionine (S)-S-oxide reductase MsrA n=1 Tax=Flavobacterium sp. TaxID=239 RepID=UPI0040497D2A